MRLIVIDKDINYLESFRKNAISKKFNMEIFIFDSLNKLEESELAGDSSCFYLIEDKVLLDFLKIYPKKEFSIFGEGIFEDEYFQELESMEISREIVTRKFISKYQRIDKILEDLKGHFIENTDKVYFSNTKAKQLIALFQPYTYSSYSRDLETTIQGISTKAKCLLIHIDPYYKPDIYTKFNLSYLFSLIKRKKQNINLLIKELIQVHTGNLHILHGPLNMMDIDCLHKNEMEAFVKLLKEDLEYDKVFLNFSGVHLSKGLSYLIQNADECVLMNKDESVQLSVTRQSYLKWRLMLNDMTLVLREVMKCHEG